MNKTPLLWGEFQKQTRNQSNAAPSNSVEHGRAQEKLTKVVSLDINHCSPYNKKCSSKTKGSFVCEDCKHVPTRNNHEPDVRIKPKLKAESVNVDELLTKVQELRGHVQFFKNRYSRSESPTTSNYQKFFRGGVKANLLSKADDFQKSINNRSGFNYNHNKNVPNYVMSGNHQPPVLDKKFSRFNNNPGLNFFTSNCFKDKASPNEPLFMQPKTSKNQKNSNESIFPLMQANKQKCLQVNPRSDIKKFHTAAEDFIGQAEDLKAKIAFILDSCGYNLPPTATTDSLESLISAISRERPLSKHSVHNTVSEHEVQRLFGTVNKQYGEILTVLMLIQEQIGSMNNAQKCEKKSKRAFRIFSKLWPMPRDSADCGTLRIPSDLESCSRGKKETPFATVPPQRRLRAGENSVIAEQLGQEAFGASGGIWKSNSPVKSKIENKKCPNKTKSKSSKKTNHKVKTPATVIPLSKSKKEENVKNEKNLRKKARKTITCFCF